MPNPKQDNAFNPISAFASTHKVTGAGKFTIDARKNLKKLDNSQKLEVIALLTVIPKLKM